MEKSNAPQQGQKEVLVVEDDHYTNELIRNTLSLAGYGVASVHSGEEALGYLEKKVPDLIILDLLLPQMDGWELCRILRKEGSPTRRVPIIIASVISRYELDQAQGALGTLSFFNKPFQPKDLIGEVERIIRG
ncbi:MAG: hypothetical protein A2902_05535 [Elusimicrobia bacterium RIFCSPLOWO2_01_FULL_64_13]|nr:MAG: hypothetical protein A2902_05535 [Elusimicrobia bacterium RIFCSPLOWO2_01_FULL_64_13]